MPKSDKDDTALYSRLGARHPNTDDEKDAARRYISKHSLDDADHQELIDMLGLNN